MSSYGHGYSSGNSYEEVREVRRGDGQGQGVCSKLCGSICCSMIGVAMYWGSLLLVAHNESSTVCVQRALESAREHYQETDCSGNDLPSGTALIHATCPFSEASMSLRTPQDFGAHWLDGAFKTRAIKVRQEVSMLQCVETKHTSERKEGDKVIKTDRWTYNIEWRDSHVESRNFKAFQGGQAREALERGCGRQFSNNPQFPSGLSSKALGPKHGVQVGAFDVSRHEGSISCDDPVALRQGSYKLPGFEGTSSSGLERRKAKDGSEYTREEFLDFYGEDRGMDEWRSASRVSSSGGGQTSISGSTVHVGNGQDVGSLRISYFQSSATHGSLLCKVSGKAGGMVKTRAWMAPSSWMCGGSSSSEVDIFSTGHFTANELIQQTEAANTAATWMIRIVTMFLAVGGVMLFLQPLQTVANLVDEFFDWFKFIPVAGWLLDLLGNAVAGAVGCAIFLVSVGIGLPSALLVLGVTWCIMRPILGIPLVLVCVAVLGYTLKALYDMGVAQKQKRA
eukprot:TRINITY_DN27270_c0_g1_i1.p1 TRINITY_DN27270_c0_g1~~TRINITY_DN27270_c0_g1_i1.p1  ORF type:complete len:508 (+),score=67.38 TRINITY_DN27270_c0_g1_i1:109-1632(+)